MASSEGPYSRYAGGGGGGPAGYGGAPGGGYGGAAPGYGGQGYGGGAPGYGGGAYSAPAPGGYGQQPAYGQGVGANENFGQQEVRRVCKTSSCLLNCVSRSLSCFTKKTLHDIINLHSLNSFHP